MIGQQISSVDRGSIPRTVLRLNHVIRIALFGAVVFSCSDSIEPNESIVVSYIATIFTLSGATTGDVLAAGGNLAIVLGEDFTTTGSLFVPASLAEGGDFRADMVGTYTHTGDVVRFTQAADSFVRDIDWQVEDSRLSGLGTFSGVTVTVVLTRQ